MMPIDSYHDALLVSYVTVVARRSPACRAMRQSGLEPVIATSQDTAPDGSKYLASERKSSLVVPLRVAVRSLYRPPGCRWPAVLTSVMSLATSHWCATPMSFFCAARACVGKVNLPLV